MSQSSQSSRAHALQNLPPVLILAAATLACLLPFLGKAVHMDDPLFIWTAHQITVKPFDFYGFTLNWEGQPAPMSLITQNPPLAAYYLALVGSLFGWSETALHAGFLAPALAVIIGTYRLAQRFCTHPLAAALVSLAAPVFLLSSTSLMCDTLMLAFWVWSVFFWMEGLKSDSPTKLAIAAVLIAACSLTKYFGISLIPLLLACSWLERRRPGRWLGWFLVPVIVLASYQWLTHRLYGHGLLLNAAAYATNLRVGGELPSKILVGLVFSGGCLVIVLLAAPLLWRAKALAAGVFSAVLIGMFAVALKKMSDFSIVDEGQVRWLVLLQLSLYATAGLGLMFLTATDLWQTRSAASLLLFLWVTGTFVFTCAVNWTISGRNILPMLPAVAILLVRRLEKLPPLWGRDRVQLLAVPAAVSLAIALLVTQADYALAASAKSAAMELHRRWSATGNDLQFEGHWGFQYYLEMLGAKALDRHNIPSDALVVLPLDNSYLFDLRGKLLFTHESVASTWLTPMNKSCGAGYYSDGWGPLPFVFGPVPARQYLVVRVK